MVSEESSVITVMSMAGQPPGPGPGRGWARPPHPASPFRPASPYGPSPPFAPSPSPYGPSPPPPPGLLVRRPMSPARLPPSPGPYLPCPRPRPRWASPGPMPYRMPPQSPSPVMCPSPEYLYAYPPPPPPGYDMMGYVPLEPPGPPEDPAAQTAAIIASQSQDYVDEKLAEYQATIQQLQGKIPVYHI
ncbi:uncharacterized protein LOC126195574 [Schistocerca nitens]|uniref:uncharacterized protein LOC126195574 n=1 Tax=Schistocerca nitens TaxID=7011 RepID=UPI0021183837|nr:uncharacterized protein LOC126195574 [Schistocerca nitens]